VADAPPYQVVTTSHLAVDGYGHALLADHIFSREDATPRGRRNQLIEAARFGLGTSSGFGAADHPSEVSQPLGIAVTELEEMPPFSAAAYALGRCLEELYRGHFSPQARRRARFSPTFHVPVAPGERSDPMRRRRRVVPGLMSVRMRDGEFEEFAEFAVRVGLQLDSDMAQRGAFARMARAALRAPLPAAAKRRLVAAGVAPRRWLPLMETLAGRGCLSLLRFCEGDQPRSLLYAVSSPALVEPSGDGLGGTVLTLVESQGRAAATMSGTGLAGSDLGSRTFLEMWVRELAQVPLVHRSARETTPW
jgi:hypothetical protein